MRASLIKSLSVGFILSLVPMLVQAKFFEGYDVECYLDTDGNNEYWFCGAQKQSCHGHKKEKKNKATWNYHGDSFTHNSRTFWCCGGTGSSTGRYYEGKDWIAKREPITISVEGGKCTWERQTNICGEVINPNGQCTEPTGECTQGYVSRGGKCIKACQSGYAFDSEKSYNCVPCETTKTRGIVGDLCVTCSLNQLFDKDTLSCIPSSSILKISALAHDTCWLCDSPSTLSKCLKLVSNGGDLNRDSELKRACSLQGSNDSNSGTTSSYSSGNSKSTGSSKTTTGSSSSGNSGSSSSGSKGSFNDLSLGTGNAKDKQISVNPDKLYELK